MGVNGNTGLGRYVNGTEGLGRSVNGNKGLGPDANGNTRPSRGVNGTKGPGRDVKGHEGLARSVNRNEGRLGRRNTEGSGDGGDVVNTVRTEMLGRGPSLGKESEREDRWI